MTIMVSDSSVLIDLERCVLLRACFSLPEVFAVPDLLYKRELRDFNGPELVAMGLQVLARDSPDVALGQSYKSRNRRLSDPDTFALALAKTGSHTLLTGDGDLRAFAHEEKVECHGVLWVFDHVEQEAVLGPADL